MGRTFSLMLRVNKKVINARLALLQKENGTGSKKHDRASKSLGHRIDGFLPHLEKNLLS